MTFPIPHLEGQLAFVGVSFLEGQCLADAAGLSVPAVQHDRLAGIGGQVAQRLVHQADQHARGLHQPGIEHLAGFLQAGAVTEESGEDHQDGGAAEQPPQQRPPHRLHAPFPAGSPKA
ncbi:hypothetical protein D3C81_1839480 [compost metagenome]